MDAEHGGKRIVGENDCQQPRILSSAFNAAVRAGHLTVKRKQASTMTVSSTSGGSTPAVRMDIAKRTLASGAVGIFEMTNRLAEVSYRGSTIDADLLWWFNVRLYELVESLLSENLWHLSVPVEK